MTKRTWRCAADFRARSAHLSTWKRSQRVRFAILLPLLKLRQELVCQHTQSLQECCADQAIHQPMSNQHEANLSVAFEAHERHRLARGAAAVTQVLDEVLALFVVKQTQFAEFALGSRLRAMTPSD